MAGPPFATETCFVMESCWPATVIEALALAVRLGSQLTTPVFVTTVPAARFWLRVARNLTTTTPFGPSAPTVAVRVEPTTLTPAAEPVIVADGLFTYVSWAGRASVITTFEADDVAEVFVTVRT